MITNLNINRRLNRRLYFYLTGVFLAGFSCGFLSIVPFTCAAAAVSARKTMTVDDFHMFYESLGELVIV